MPRTERDVADPLRELGEARGFRGRPVVRDAAAGVRAEERVAQRSQQVVGDAARIVARHHHLVHTHERAGDVFVGRGVEHGHAQLERHPAERGVHLRVVEMAAADRERLVEERQRVARRAAGAAGDEVERLGVGLDALAGQDVGEVAHELVVRQQRELEVLRARPDRRQHLLRIGGREHEHHVRGRLLERLQQRVRGRRREHVHLVDDVDLAPARGAHAEMHALDEVAHRVDPVVGRGVELDEIEERARGDRLAVLALAAGLAVGAELEAVERPGEDAGGGGLAGAARAREQVRVAGAVFAHRVAQRVRDVALADELGEMLGPVLAIQALGGHQAMLPTRSTAAQWPARAMSGPARRAPVNRVRSGRKQLSAEAPGCRRVA